MKRCSILANSIIICSIIMFLSSGCQPEEQVSSISTEPAATETIATPEPAEITPDATAPVEPVEQAKSETVIKKAEAPADENISEPEGKTTAAAPDKPAEQTEESTDDSASVLATVNGFDITQTAVEQKIQPRLERVPQNSLERVKPMMIQQTLEKMIVEHLLDEKLKNAAIEISDEQVTAYLTTMGAKQDPPISPDELKKQVESRGQNFDVFKSHLEKYLSFQELLKSEGYDTADVNEEQAHKYYTENQKQFEKTEQVHAQHILIKLVPDANTDPNQVAKAKIEKLLKRLQAGEDFAKLAEEYSDCPSAKKGGDLGSFGKGQMVPPFEKAAFELEVGQVSDVVKTRFGYHIIKVIEHNQASITDFENAKDRIIGMLTAKKNNELAKKYIDSLKQQATITYHTETKPK